MLTPEDLARCDEIAHGPQLVRTVAAEVAKRTGIPVAEIMGSRRWTQVAAARQLVYFIAFNRGVAISQIALAMNRDESTVHYGINAERVRRG